MASPRIDPCARISRLSRLLCVLALAPLASTALASPDAASSTSSATHTIGLVLTDWRYALYETPGKEECPAGLNPGEVTEFRAMPNPQEHLNKFGAIQNRGPNGENPSYTPMAVEDVLPFSELKTKVGYGFNLDGTPDGHAMPKTCAHEKFTSPTGEAVDNQMARVVGCVLGWRTSGFMAEFLSKNDLESSTANRVLFEITGIHDEKNDPSVEVSIYKGRDRLVRAPSGSFIPFVSQRIDKRFPQYMFKTHGKIVDGVLITDPIPLARIPVTQIQETGERRIHDMRLRLKLDANGAEGMAGGYEDLNAWWTMHGKSASVGTDIGAYSPAALYRAAHRYADGYPEAATGKCTAISVGYKITAVRVLIVHPPEHRSGVIVAQSDKMQ